MKKIGLVCVVLLFIGLIGLVFADEYAWTTAYFYLPSDVSFGVFLLGTAVNTSSIDGSQPGQQTTTWISFNATSSTQYEVQPMTTGAKANEQTGPTNSIIRIYNMGNTAFKFYMNASVEQACIQNLCANSTCGGAGCASTSSCTPIKNLLGPSWATLSTNLPENGYLNITMYANFVSCSPFTSQGAIFYKSSSS
jgi:hypothetical protein